MYTINQYDNDGKYTLMQPFSNNPMLFSSYGVAWTYAKEQGYDMEQIKIEQS